MMRKIIFLLSMFMFLLALPFANSAGRSFFEVNVTQNETGFIPAFSINVTIDTAALITENVLQSTCIDLVPQQFDSLINYSLDNCNSVESTLTFKVNLTNGTTSNIKIWYDNASWIDNYSTLNYSNAYWDILEGFDVVGDWTTGGVCSIDTSASKTICTVTNEVDGNYVEKNLSWPYVTLEFLVEINSSNNDLVTTWGLSDKDNNKVKLAGGSTYSGNSTSSKIDDPNIEVESRHESSFSVSGSTGWGNNRVVWQQVRYTQDTINFTLYNVSMVEQFVKGISGIGNNANKSFLYAPFATSSAGRSGNIQILSLFLRSYLENFVILTTKIQSNQINITIFDEITEKKITDNVTVEMIGDDFAENITTSNGQVNDFTNWPLGEYQFNYFSAKYTKRTFYVTFTNTTDKIVDLHLLSITNGTDVTFIIQDSSGTPLEEATIRLKRYFISTNSYRTVAMIRTNAVGQASIDVDFNDAFYETLTTFGAFSLQTIGAKFIITSLILSIDLLADILRDDSIIEGITSSISFNNVTQTFSFTFTDNSGQSRTGLLEVHRITPIEDTIVCTSTDTSSSATLLCVVNTTAANATYNARGFIATSSGNRLVRTISIGVGFIKLFRNQIFQTQGDFFAILLGGTLAGLGLGVSPAVGIIMFLVGLGAINFFGFVIIESITYATFVILGLLLIWKLKR